jgi:DNA polymerase-3 subunit alpha
MIFISDFSLLDSSLTIKKAVELAKEKGFKKVILADSNLSGALTFYYAAKGADLEPVIGVQGVYNGVKYLFISHNRHGYSALTEAESIGYSEKLFSDENLTAIAIDILQPNAEIKSAYGALKPVNKIIDKAINKYIEENVQHVLPIRLGNIKEEKDFFTVASLQAIGNGTQYENEIAEGNVYCSTMNEKEELTDSSEFIEILAKTVNDYEFGNPKPPFFKFGKEVGPQFGLEDPSNDDLFEAICWYGLKKRVEKNEIPNENGDIPQEYKDRLIFEMNVIKGMTFPGYFLIVWDFIKEARKMGIAVGPGRGSAAGSLVAYALEITNLDPIPYNLLFERFLNPDRVNFPDIDIDFSKARRGEVIDYVTEKYGHECVAQVITFGTLGAKGVIRDSARIMNAPLYLADKMAKLVPEDPSMTLEKAYKGSTMEWESMFDKDFIARKIWDKSVSLENYKRNLGVHAAGLVISNDAIYNRAPLYNVNGAQVVGYEGGFLEDVNLVKYDFLGLKTLDVIDNAVKMIKRDKGIEIDIENVDLNDKVVLDYISKGFTIGMFQIESPGMQDLNQRLQPSSFEDLIAVLALYRPGPMEAGMLDSFINRKHGREKIDYFFKAMEEKLKPILEPTYGLIVYQEQVQQIVRAIGGFSLGEGDLVRRAMGKKKPEEMARISKEFIERAAELGYDKSESKQLFDLIEKFAGYGFNKSHSAAYAKVSFQTAWLKVHYPEYFMAALINSDMEDKDKLTKYISESKRMGIEVTVPSVKECSDLFDVIGDKRIGFGLKAVKGVGGGAKALIKAIEKVGKDSTIQELLLYTQRNVKKEHEAAVKLVARLTKQIASTEKKYGESYQRVMNLQPKFETGTLTQRQLGTYNKNTALLEELTVKFNQQIAEKEATEQLVISLEAELETAEEHEKLSKRVFEPLAKVGAFECYGVTRKSVLENIEMLLDPKKIMKVEFTAEEFTPAEKMVFEEEATGLIISDIFTKEQRDLLDSIEIPEDMPIGIIINKETRRKKNGQEFLQVKVMIPNGDIIEGSDFNLVCKNLEIGTLASFLLRINGKYTNFVKAQTVSEKVINEYPAKKIVHKMTILEDTSSVDLDKVEMLEVYDLDGSLIAKFSKRVS